MSRVGSCAQAGTHHSRVRVRDSSALAALSGRNDGSLAAAIPPIPGIVTSISTSRGESRSTARAYSSSELASPTSRKPGAAAIRSRSTPRNASRSSTANVLTSRTPTETVRADDPSASIGTSLTPRRSRTIVPVKRPPDVHESFTLAARHMRSHRRITLACPPMPSVLPAGGEAAAL